MILIRGIGGEEYAKQIERGIVGCRDLLSYVISPPSTVYTLSDYYEKNLVTAVTQCVGMKPEDFMNPSVLYSILIDYYLPFIYLTYFHILNSNSLNWLEKYFPDSNNDTYFIAVDVELDKLTRTAIGNGYFGAKMRYIKNIQDIDQELVNGYSAAILCSIVNYYPDIMDSYEALNIYNTLAFPLLHREVDSKFTNIENEFRIIAYDCPVFRRTKLFHKPRRIQVPRDITINCNSGNNFKGTLYPGKDYLLQNLDNRNIKKQKRLNKLLFEENGNIRLEKHFKPLNISGIASSCRFIGNKKACEKYIVEMNSRPQYDVLIERIVERKYSLDDFEDVCFAPSKRIIQY